MKNTDSMRSLLTIVISLYVFVCTFAQDTIHFVNGELVAAKVLNISEESIVFKKQENLEGPDYTINLNKIEKIVFSNGVVEEYNKTKKEETHSSSQPKQKAVFRKGNLLQRGNSVYVKNQGKTQYEAAATRILILQILRTNIWKVVNSPELAHFTLEYTVDTRGSDKAFVKISTVLGTTSTDKRDANEDLYENKDLAKKIFDKDLLPLVKSLDKGKTPNLIKRFTLK